MMPHNNDSSNFRSQYYYQLGVKSIVSNPSQLLILPLSQLKNLCLQNTQFPISYRGRVMLRVLETAFCEEWLKIIGGFQEIQDRLELAFGSVSSSSSNGESVVSHSNLNVDVATSTSNLDMTSLVPRLPTQSASHVEQHSNFLGTHQNQQLLLLQTKGNKTTNPLSIQIPNSEDSLDEDLSSTSSASDFSIDAVNALVGAMIRLEERMEDNIDPIVVEFFKWYINEASEEIKSHLPLNLLNEALVMMESSHTPTNQLFSTRTSECLDKTEISRHVSSNVEKNVNTNTNVNRNADDNTDANINTNTNENTRSNAKMQSITPTFEANIKLDTESVSNPNSVESANDFKIPSTCGQKQSPNIHNSEDKLLPRESLILEKIPKWIFGKMEIPLSIIDMTLQLWENQIEAWEVSLDSVNYNGWTSRGLYLRCSIFESIEHIQKLIFRTEPRAFLSWRSGWRTILESIQETEMKHQYLMYLSFSKMMLKFLDKEYFMLGDWEESLGKVTLEFLILCSEAHKRVFSHLQKLSFATLEKQVSISDYTKLLPSVWTKDELLANDILVELHPRLIECFLNWFASFFSIIFPHDVSLLLWSVIFCKQPIEYIPCLGLAIIDNLRIIIPNLKTLDELVMLLSGDIAPSSNSGNSQSIDTKVSKLRITGGITPHGKSAAQETPRTLRQREWRSDELINKSINFLKTKGQLFQEYKLSRESKVASVAHSFNQGTNSLNANPQTSAIQNDARTSTNEGLSNLNSRSPHSVSQSHLSRQSGSNTSPHSLGRTSSTGNLENSNIPSVKSLPARLLGKSSGNNPSIKQIRNILSPSSKTK